MVFNLLRINVHPARNDHKAFAVSEVQIALFIHATNVAKRCPAMLVGGAFGFFRIIMVAERRRAFKEYGAFFANWHIIPVLVTNVHNRVQRPPNRSLMR